MACTDARRTGFRARHVVTRGRGGPRSDTKPRAGFRSANLPRGARCHDGVSLRGPGDAGARVEQNIRCLLLRRTLTTPGGPLAGSRCALGDRRLLCRLPPPDWGDPDSAHLLRLGGVEDLPHLFDRDTDHPGHSVCVGQRVQRPVKRGQFWPHPPFVPRAGRGIFALCGAFLDLQFSHLNRRRIRPPGHRDVAKGRLKIGPGVTGQDALLRRRVTLLSGHRTSEPQFLRSWKHRLHREHAVDPWSSDLRRRYPATR